MKNKTVNEQLSKSIYYDIEQINRATIELYKLATSFQEIGLSTVAETLNEHISNIDFNLGDIKSLVGALAEKQI
jgi:hypothetical protein